MLMFAWGLGFAQDAQSVPVERTNARQTLKGRDYYCHIVQQGQTVYSIARAYGVSYTSAITRTDIHQLRVGDTVWLPASNEMLQTTSRPTKIIRVEPKETLYGLSRQYAMTVEELLDMNPKLKDRSLQAGEYIMVPATADEYIANSDEQFGGEYDYTAVSPKKPKPETSKVQPEEKASPTNNNPEKQEEAERPEKSNTLEKPESQAAPTAPTQQTQQTQPSKQEGATPSVFPFPVHERVSPNKLYISLLMPLNLENLDKISTTKFDVDQRGKREYKVFEMLQFYEGMLIAAEELKRQGYNIVLNVVDIAGGAATAVESAYQSHHVGNSDFIIALLERDAFAVAARLASNDKVFIINPVSLRSEILDNAPYVIKMQPSPEGTVSDMLDIIARRDEQLYIIHSNGKLEKALHDELQQQLTNRTEIRHTWFDWAVNGKLATTLRQTASCSVIAIYDQGKDKNRIFSNQIINRLIALKTTEVTLFTFTNYITEYPDVDYSHLQRLNYHTVYPFYLDYSNETHRSFIEQFKETYKTEPTGRFAGMGHDVMLYFATGLHQRGTNFWKNCAIAMPQNMLFPLHFRQKSADDGFENQLAPIYRMRNLQIEKASRH
ncbi:MAG: LysM peptidoglycan-binding domain-containing protein [Bacteroidales bacterium]|nr:LysM peptidoglycan-binding domain-containing protein [Bacteroidales bacterium]